MSESKIDVEAFGIGRVSDVLRKASHLSPRLTEFEKSEGYDGYVAIIDHPTGKIEDEKGRVYVQVKTRSKKNVSYKDKASYRIEKRYIEYYCRNHPLIYFVVFKSDNDHSCIYYKELDKISLHNYARIKGDLINVEMRRLDKTPSQLDDMFLVFHEKNKVQERIEPNKQIHALELLTGNYRPIFQAPTFHPEEQNLFSRINSGNAIMYCERDNILYHLQTDRLKLSSFKTDIDCKLSIGSDVFFSKAQAVLNEKSITICFDDTIRITLQLGETNAIKLDYTLQTCLSSLIPAMRFLVALGEKGHCNISFYGKTIPCVLNPLPHDFVAFCKEKLPVFDQINRFFSSIGVNRDIDVSKVKGLEYRVACKIYDSIENGTEIEINDHDEDAIRVYFDFGKEQLAFLAIKQQSGMYRMFNELGIKNRRGAVLYIDGKCYKVPFETCFRDSAIWSCANFNKDNYISALSDALELEPETALVVNDNDFLNILRGYDKSKDEDLLDLALAVNKLLKTYATDLLAEPLSTLNYLQVIRRKSKLSDSEKAALEDYLSEERVLENKIAILLLLDRFDKAKEFLNKLSESARKDFLSYPIAALFPKKYLEDGDNN